MALRELLTLPLLRPWYDPAGGEFAGIQLWSSSYGWRGVWCVAEVTLMGDSTKVIHSFLQEFYLVYLFIYYLLLVVRHQQPYDVDHVCTYM